MNRLAKQTVLGVFAVASLSACQKSACDYTPSSSRITAADQMATCLNSLPVTPVANMPQSGSATYDGFLVGTMTPGGGGASDSLIGDATLTANFTGAGGSVAGSASNISSTTSGDLSGTLSIGGGTIAGALIVGANLTGTLTATSAETLTFSGTMAGGFSGDTANGINLATALAGSPATVVSSVSGTGTADLVVSGMD